MADSTVCDIETDYFRELIVRWFPVLACFALLCGCMEAGMATTGPVIFWSPQVATMRSGVLAIVISPFCGIGLSCVSGCVPILRRHMDIASETGVPVMRPMFFDYPEDPVCYQLGEQYLFGDDIIFAPIVRQDREATVYTCRKASGFLPAMGKSTRAARGMMYLLSWTSLLPLSRKALMCFQLLQKNK